MTDVFVLKEQGPCHSAKDVSVRKGLRYVLVKCGELLPGEDPDKFSYVWTCWFSEITCPKCLEGYSVRD